MLVVTLVNAEIIGARVAIIAVSGLVDALACLAIIIGAIVAVIARQWIIAVGRAVDHGVFGAGVAIIGAIGKWRVAAGDHQVMAGDDAGVGGAGVGVIAVHRLVGAGAVNAEIIGAGNAVIAINGHVIASEEGFVFIERAGVKVITIFFARKNIDGKEDGQEVFQFHSVSGLGYFLLRYRSVKNQMVAVRALVATTAMIFHKVDLLFMVW